MTLNLQFLSGFLQPPLSHFVAIFAALLLTYARVLGKDFFWVIDDEGVFKYSDQFIPEKKDAAGKVIEPEKEVRTYSCCEGDKKHEVKMLAFNPHAGFPGAIIRFLRINIGKRFGVIGTNSKGHEIYGMKQSPRRHHIFSMIVHAANLVLGYFFLSPLIGQDLAFAACILYSVHPLTTQTVGWISGVMYALSMLFALATLNCSLYLHSYYWIIPLTVIFSFISSVTLFLGCFTFIILLFLGFKWAAFTSALVGLFILLWKGKETKDYRAKAFKEQAMDKTLYLNWRKPIVMIKTLFYYLPMMFMPIRMGLYHIWGYFYEEPIERADRMFWAGIAAIGLIVLGYTQGSLAIQLGLTWYLSYFFIFSNFITAQQFVADRYGTVPAFGMCIVIASLLYGTPLFWILLGLYAMRTFLHLPTFKNDLDFYLSNFLNFRRSEVALGNLGASYINQGMAGSAVDTWLLSTKINPYYDVAWYNLYSIFKANGKMLDAKAYLENCLRAKVVHFKDRWEKEYEDLKKQMEPSECQKLFDLARQSFDAKDFAKEEELLNQIISLPSNLAITQIVEGAKHRLSEIKIQVPK